MKAPRLLLTLAALVLVLSSSACAIDRGTGFASLGEATLEIEFRPGAARDLGDDRVLTDQGYEVSVERALVRVESVQLQVVAEADTAQSFDPANPPPGYSLCHSGHCHRDDGALVDYADIEVELAGGSEAFAPLVVLDFDEPLSLLAGQPTTADRYEPSRELPRSDPRRVLVTLTRLEIEGTVSGGALEDDQSELSIDLPLGIDLDTTVEGLRIDRDGPARFDLHTRVVVEGTLFDDLDFASFREAGTAPLDDPNSVASQTLVASLAASETSVTVD